MKAPTRKLISDRTPPAHGGALKDTRGSNLVEYVILAGVVALIALAGFKFLGDRVAAQANDQASSVETINGAAR